MIELEECVFVFVIEVIFGVQNGNNYTHRNGVALAVNAFSDSAHHGMGEGCVRKSSRNFSRCIQSRYSWYQWKGKFTYFLMVWNSFMFPRNEISKTSVKNRQTQFYGKTQQKKSRNINEFCTDRKSFQCWKQRYTLWPESYKLEKFREPERL